MTFDRRARHRYTGWSIIGGWRLAAVLVLLACGRAGADAVTDWNTFTVSLIAPRPEVTVATAYVHIAIFDAINAIEGGFTPFAVRMSDVPTGASPVAAAAAAAHVILSRLYPSFQSQIDAEYYSAIAKTPPGQGRTDGIAVGEAAANGLLTLHAWPNDGWNANVPYTFQPAGPGVYQQTPGPPPSGAYIGPVTPWLKQFRPFSMRRPSQFRGDGPPPLSSKRWARAFNEVKDLGALTGSIRTPEQSEIGLFYGAIVAGIQIG